MIYIRIQLHHDLFTRFLLLWIEYEIDWKGEPILKRQGQGGEGGRESQKKEKKKERKFGGNKKKGEPRKRPPSLFRLGCSSIWLFRISNGFLLSGCGSTTSAESGPAGGVRGPKRQGSDPSTAPFELTSTPQSQAKSPDDNLCWNGHFCWAIAST